ncbi:hypothetical protein N692_07035 [Lactiplantibacillus plantarum EGD-AQ4]|nr:hypothetical protein N692_07035 [Lactiplantibacillus plantarum EGD-AQ4]
MNLFGLSLLTLYNVAADMAMIIKQFPRTIGIAVLVAMSGYLKKFAEFQVLCVIIF